MTQAATLHCVLFWVITFVILCLPACSLCFWMNAKKNQPMHHKHTGISDKKSTVLNMNDDITCVEEIYILQLKAEN